MSRISREGRASGHDRGRQITRPAPYSVMIRAVTRGFLLLMMVVAARAETLDDAVAALAKKISARLGTSETALVTSRNISSLPAVDAAKAHTALTRALQRRVRNPMQVAVALTISESLRGYLLVAEIRRESETIVEMTDFRLSPPAAPAPAAFTMESKQLWEQEMPILDIAVLPDSMLVLDNAGLARYVRVAGKWDRASALDIPLIARDPRGRLEINGDSVTIHEPGVTCTVPIKLTAPPQCDEGGRFKADRNTQDLHDWRGEFFASAELGSDMLLAGLDGRIHIHDAAHVPQAVFDGGSDLAVISACGGSHIAFTGAGDMASPDSIALYDLVNRSPVRVSEPIELSGPVTALWPAGEGAVAVAQNLSTGKYAAYTLTLDCGR
jgi:hypothetical protein